ncbi:MAG: glutamine amidotransferase [Eubacteriales bacterium]
MKINICHLYPDLLDLYGDRGNVLALTARCKWRKIETDVKRISLGDEIDFSRVDILFIGGGSDREQEILVDDLKKREKEFRKAIENGLVVLAICGGYQMLGKYYHTFEGEKIPGLGILDLYTVGGKKRLIGNLIAEMDVDLKNAIDHNYSVLQDSDLKVALNTLTGFENHSGKTYLGEGLKPLGKVIKGFGNNGEDGFEGVQYKNVFGTYLHGPLLPKNPRFADLLLGLAVRRKEKGEKWVLLEDDLEIMAHRAVVKRFCEG